MVKSNKKKSNLENSDASFNTGHGKLPLIPHKSYDTIIQLRISYYSKYKDDDEGDPYD